MSNRKNQSQKTALLGIFAAITVVLQLMSYFIKIGTFNLSLVLIPIVLSAVLYGPKFGAVIGGVFGITVVIATVSGLDAGAYLMFDSAPVVTVLLCLIKGVAAGACAGLIANALKKKHPYLAAATAAMIAPIVNTGIFITFLPVFYKDLLIEWAAGTEITYYIVFGLVGINFLIEMLINVIFLPILYRLSKAIQRIRT